MRRASGGALFGGRDTNTIIYFHYSISFVQFNKIIRLFSYAFGMNT